MDPCLCTHILYSFVRMSNNKLAPRQHDLDLLAQMNKWKSVNPNLKILASVGGWTEGVTF